MRAKGSAGWGGPRLGSGRPPGTGSGQSPNARRNRVVIMLSDAEIARLKKLAARARLPAGTLAYDFFSRGMRRAK